jgi:hypothetical protein
MSALIITSGRWTGYLEAVGNNKCKTVKLDRRCTYSPVKVDDRYNVDNFSRDCASKTIDSISALLPLEAWVALSAAQRPLLTTCVNCTVASSEVRTSPVTNVVSTLFFSVTNRSVHCARHVAKLKSSRE